MNSNDISTQPERTNWSAIWQLIKPYWVSDKKWQGYRLLIAVVGLSLGMVYVNVLINSWNRELFDALQNRNPTNFYHLMWRFTYLAIIYILFAIYRVYFRQALQMDWRMWMTTSYQNKWLSHGAYYQIQQKHYADNPDQRIAEDLNAITDSLYPLAAFFGSLEALLIL
jgi:putative ATP-binding cassette transporter